MCVFFFFVSVIYGVLSICLCTGYGCVLRLIGERSAGCVSNSQILLWCPRRKSFVAFFTSLSVLSLFCLVGEGKTVRRIILVWSRSTFWVLPGRVCVVFVLHGFAFRVFFFFWGVVAKRDSSLAWFIQQAHDDTPESCAARCLLLYCRN